MSTKGMNDKEFVNFIAAASEAMGYKAKIVSTGTDSSGKEASSDKSRKIAVSKLQLDVFQQLKYANTMISLENLCRRYRKYSEWDIKYEMNDLVKKGVLLGGDGIIGCMYGIADPNVTLYPD